MVELEGANAVCVHLPRLIADHDDLQAVLRLELGNEVKHSEKRLRLSEHKLAKLVTRQGVLLMKHHPAQIFFKGELALLVYLKYETVTLIHFGPVQIEVPGRPLARKIVPSIG